MNTVEVLVVARAKVDTPEKWITNQYDRDDAYCAVGACMAAAGYDMTNLSASYEQSCVKSIALCYLEKVVGHNVVTWNDAKGRTHAEVLAAFDKAIELARAEQAAGATP